MISIRTFTHLLWALAFLLFGVAFFTHSDPTTLFRVNDFLDKNVEILTSVGIIIFIGVLTVYATHLSNLASAKREMNNRHISAEIKLSEFRQSWINALRDDIAELSAHLASSDHQDTEVKYRKILLLNRIKLRINRQDTNYEVLLEALRSAVDEASKNRKLSQGKNTDQHREFIRVSQDLLKSEWERLKIDLRLARIGDIE